MVRSCRAVPGLQGLPRQLSKGLTHLQAASLQWFVIASPPKPGATLVGICIRLWH